MKRVKVLRSFDLCSPQRNCQLLPWPMGFLAKDLCLCMPCQKFSLFRLISARKIILLRK